MSLPGSPLVVSDSISSWNPQQKADYYGSLLGSGYSDSEVRFAVEKAMGAQSDENWRALQGLAGNPQQGTGGLKLPGQIQSFAPEQKATVFGDLMGSGFDSNALRSATESQFGTQSDSDWGQLQSLAGNPMPAAQPGNNTLPGYNLQLSDVSGWTPQQKSDYFNTLVASGFGDQQIRQAAERTMGPQTDANWRLLRGIADNPTQGAGGLSFDADIPNLAAPQKATIYSDLLRSGFTDQQIRQAAERQFGAQTSENWLGLQNLASGRPAAVSPTQTFASRRRFATTAAPSAPMQRTTQGVASGNLDQGPVAYQSSLIRSLRAASPAGFSNTGFTVYSNPENGAPLTPPAPAPAPVAPAPSPTQAPAPAPASVDPVVNIPANDGTRVTPVERVPAGTTVTSKTNDDKVIESLDDIEDSDVVVGDDLVVDTTPLTKTTITTTLPKVETGTTDKALKQDASHWGQGGENLVAGDQVTGSADDVNGADLDSDQYTFGVLKSDEDKPLKKDASEWGEGGDDLVAGDDGGTLGVLLSDMDDDTLGDVDDVNGADLDSDQYTFGVLASDIDAADSLGSVDDVNGADLQSDQYNFGVRMDDVDDPGSSDDVNGSDLASDQYTLGVLMSDQDPVREEIIDVNQLIDELNLLAFAKEAEKKLEEKFGDTEFAYQ